MGIIRGKHSPSHPNYVPRQRSAFSSGFEGCLGVLAAIVFIIVLGMLGTVGGCHSLFAQ